MTTKRCSLIILKGSAVIPGEFMLKDRARGSQRAQENGWHIVPQEQSLKLYRFSGNETLDHRCGTDCMTSGKGQESHRAIFVSLYFQGKPSEKSLGQSGGCNTEGLRRRALCGGAAWCAASRAGSVQWKGDQWWRRGWRCGLGRAAQPMRGAEGFAKTHMARMRILIVCKLIAGVCVTSTGKWELSDETQ